MSSSLLSDLPKAGGPADNPYFSARRQWNSELARALSSERVAWLIALACLLIALSSVGGIAWIGAQSKLVPYVVQVDKLGATVTGQALERAAPADPTVIKHSLAEFIASVRLVTPDVEAQRAAWRRVYSMIRKNDPAFNQLLGWYGKDKESDPEVRATKEKVSVDIIAVLPQTPQTWLVDWKETVENRDGTPAREPFLMRANIVFYVDPNAVTDQATRLLNPLNVFVRSYSWVETKY